MKKREDAQCVFPNCTKIAFYHMVKGACGDHIIIQASKPDSVARRDFNARITSGPKPTVTMYFDGKKCKLPARGAKGNATLPLEVAVDTIKDVVSEEDLRSFRESYASRVEGYKKRRARENAKKRGEDAPTIQTKFCINKHTLNSHYPLCINHEITGCNSQAALNTPGLPCHLCGISGCSEVVYNKESRTLDLFIEIEVPGLVNEKDPGDVHVITCMESENQGGFKYDGKVFTFPTDDDAGVVVVNAYPYDALVEVNQAITDPMVPKYKILEPQDLMDRRDKYIAARAEYTSLSKQRQEKVKVQRHAMRIAESNQDPASEEMIRYTMDVLTDLLKEGIKSEHTMISISTGILHCLPSIHTDVFQGIEEYNKTKATVDPKEEGLMSWLDKTNIYLHNTVQKMSMKRKEERKFITEPKRGPGMHKASGEYITNADLEDGGSLSSEYRCTLVAVGRHQQVLDLETHGQRLAKSLAEMFKNEYGVQIGFLFQNTGAGNHVGYVNSPCALSLTMFHSNLIRDGTLKINTHRRDNFKLQLLDSLNLEELKHLDVQGRDRNSVPVEAAMSRCACPPIDNKYLDHLEYLVNRREKKKAGKAEENAQVADCEDDRKLPAKKSTPSSPRHHNAPLSPLDNIATRSSSNATMCGSYSTSPKGVLGGSLERDMKSVQDSKPPPNIPSLKRAAVSSNTNPQKRQQLVPKKSKTQPTLFAFHSFKPKNAEKKE